MFAYYDRAADIAWFPTGKSADVVSEHVPGGLHDHDRTSNKLVAIEVWDASTRLPTNILEALPAPSAGHGTAALRGHRPPKRGGSCGFPLWS